MRTPKYLWKAVDVIHFLVENWNAAIHDAVEAAVFETALRIGAPFSIHRSTATLPGDARVVRYSAAPADGDFHGLDLPAAPSAYSFQLPCVESCWRDRFLWAPQTEQDRDVIAGVHNLLTFSHEKSVDIRKRDVLGRIPAEHHPLHRNGLLQQPLMENNAEYVRALIERHYGNQLPPGDPWGGGKYVVCMTHDVDGPSLHSLFAMLRSLYLAVVQRDLREREAFELGLLTRLGGARDPYWNFEDWMRLERLFECRSTFFFAPGRVSDIKPHPRDPRYDPASTNMRREIQRIRDAGWEIGLHAGINGHTEAGYASARHRLRYLGGGDISGCRAHYWALNWEKPYESWARMWQAGLSYDASINPLSSGYRGGTMFPIHASPTRDGPRTDSFLAIPTVFMDAYLSGRHSHSRQASRERRETVRQIVKRTRGQRGLIVLDWHVRTLSNVGAWKGYLNLILEVLDAIHGDSDARFLTLEEAAQRWRAYATRLFAGSSMPLVPSHCPSS